MSDVRQLLKPTRSLREAMDAMLTVGGIPEYLKYLNGASSIFLGLCQNAFTQGAFFANEYARIFSSSLSNNPDYQKIIRFLSHRSFALRSEIAAHLRIQSGGRLTQLLRDLEICGFITNYTPFQLASNSLVSRYHISDQYLQFYFRFVEPKYLEIQEGHFNQNPTQALNMEAFDQWLGFSFERFCRKHHYLLARSLGFGAVAYRSGAFFNRETEEQNRGYQMDLVFDRKDKVYTVCEIKYLRTPATKKVIADFEQKLSLFPRKRGYSLEKVLIVAEGADPSLEREGYFDRVITLKDLFDSTLYNS